MMISGGGPAFTDKRPIEDYTVGSGTAFGAELRNQVDSSFLANIARKGKIGLERQAREDAMRRAKPIHKASTFYDAETARQKVKDAGVDYTIPDEGVQVDEFETMLELRKRQRREEITVSRRPKTWLGAGAVLAGDFTAGLVDPINVAASYIPIVGQLRYARWLERAGSAGGRAAVRLGVGAAEGTVGAAAYEGLNLAFNRSLPENYGLADSFLNVAFGGVLGGGLHAVGGLIHDVTPSRARVLAERASSERQRAALTQAVVALDGGKRLDVAPVFRAADARLDPLNDAEFLSREVSRGVDVMDADIEAALTDVRFAATGETGPRDLVRDIIAHGGIRIVDRHGNITPEGQALRDVYDGRYPPGLVNNKRGVPLDYVRERLEEEGWFPGREGDTVPDDVVQLLAQHQGGRKPIHPEETALEDSRPVKAEMKAAGIKPSDPEDRAAFKLAQYRALKALRERGDGPDYAIESDVYDPATGFEPRDMADLRAQADEALALRDDGTDLDGEIEALTEYLAMASSLGQRKPRVTVRLAEPKGGKPDSFLEHVSVRYEGASAEPNRRVYVVQNPDGDAGWIDLKLVGAGTLRVNDIVATHSSGSSSNSFGPSTVREILRQIRDLHPSVTKITGERVSGARMGGQHFFEGAGKEVEINLPSKKDEMPDLSGLSDSDLAILALADEFDAKAKRSGAAYKAAAACLSGLA